MVGRRWWAAQPWKFIQKPLALGLAAQMLWGSWGGSAIAATLTTRGTLTETAPPKTVQTLQRVLEQYQPQIKILSPKAGELLTDNTVSLSFEVKDLPIYKEKTLQLGPHLHLVLDDQPYQSIYNANEPFILKDLEPGTHTLRLFAARPWDESFKNDGAFAQVTFHVFTKTDNNQPNPQKPLLTYNQPQGTYGAEPILLDFYLTNAPLHLIAQENETDNIQDWKIKATVNGQSFLLDRWQPTYLQGFKPGKNWVQLEFIDQNGTPVGNFGNNTARIFNYEPNGSDPLAQLTRGELTIAQVKGIVDPTYRPPAPPKSIETPLLAPIVKPVVQPTIEPTAPTKAVLPNPAKSNPKTESQSTESQPKAIKPEITKPEITKPEAIESPPLPSLPIVPIIPIPQKTAENQTESKSEKAKSQPEKIKSEKSVPEKSTESTVSTTTEPKKSFQKRLPFFMGPGKKVDVKTPIIETPVIEPSLAPESKPAQVKPVETESTEKKAVEVKSTTTRPTQTQSAAKKPVGDVSPKKDPEDKKSEETQPTSPKKVNWLDRFRQSSASKPEQAPTEQKPVKDSNKDSKPTESPKPEPSPQPIPTPKPISTENKPELQSTDNNVQKKPAIETRKPFKFNFFSPGKKTEVTLPNEPISAPQLSTPELPKALTTKVIDQPKPIETIKTTATKQETDAPKLSHWLDRFRKPATERSETKSEVKSEAKPDINAEVKSTESKNTSTPLVESKPIEMQPVQAKQIDSTSRKQLQFSPGKAIDVKTPARVEVKPEVKVSPKPEVKTGVTSEVKAPTKSEVKPVNIKPEVKILTKPEVQPVNIKPEAKTPTKSDITTPIKSEVKPSIKSDEKSGIKLAPSKSTVIPTKPLPETKVPVVTDKLKTSKKSEETSDNWFDRIKQDVQQKIASPSSDEKKTEITTDIKQTAPTLPDSNSREVTSPKNEIKPIVQPIAKVQPTVKIQPTAKPETLTTIAKPQPVKSFTVTPTPEKIIPLPTPSPQPSIKPIAQPTVKPIVKSIAQPAIKPIDQPTNPPTVIQSETPKPKNTTDSKVPESTSNANRESMQELIDRLNKAPTPPTPQKSSLIPTQSQITGEELIKQLKSRFKAPESTPGSTDSGNSSDSPQTQKTSDPKVLNTNQIKVG